MVLCLLLLPGMARAGTGADSPEKKAASAVNNKRNVRQKITPVGTRKSTSVRPLSVCEVKVRLCKLINSETNVLLLDEPTNHLDEIGRASCRERV